MQTHSGPDRATTVTLTKIAQVIMLGLGLAFVVAGFGYLTITYLHEGRYGNLAGMLLGVPVCIAMTRWAMSPLRDLADLPLAYQPTTAEPVQRQTIVVDQYGRPVCCASCSGA